MKKLFLLISFAAALLCQPVSAQDTSNPTNELKALIAKINVDIQSGKRTEAELSGDLQQFDALLAEHKGEKTDIMARVLYMKATLYSEVIGDDAKADALIKQLKANTAALNSSPAWKSRTPGKPKLKKSRIPLR